VELPVNHAIDLLQVTSPNSADLEGALYTLAFSYYLLKDYEKAVPPFSRYIEGANRNGRKIDPDAMSALGRSLYFLGRQDEALVYLAASGKADSKQKGTDYYYAGYVYFNRGETDKAIDTLGKAVQASPAETEPIELLIEALLRKAKQPGQEGVGSEAVQYAEKLQTIRDDSKTVRLLGRVYLQAGQFNKAVPIFERLIKETPDEKEIFLYYGISLGRSGQRRKAVDVLERASESLQNPTAALAELAYLYEVDGQYSQALRVYEKAYSLSGEKDESIKRNIDRVRAQLQSNQQNQ
jgi:tetratricopeptide (TPR) repeat protein